jgi:positive regulator of sigma E activity
MENLSWKTRIAVLWLIMAVVYAAHMALSIFEPGVIEAVPAGDIKINEGIFIFSAVFVWLIPLTMAFLSVTMKNTTNRRTNLLMGIVFIMGNFGHLLIEQFTQPSIHMAQPSIHQLLLNLATVAVAVLIAWYAWKWPKPE